jgi:DNA-binding phage protein
MAQLRRAERAAETRFRIRAARGAGTQARGLEENDPALIAHALGVIARAKDMIVINALGLRLHATAAPAA